MSLRDHYEPALLNTCIDGNPEWSQVVCGGDHSAGVTKMGEVYTWGYNRDGQLGHGDYFSRPVPTKVLSLSGFVVIKVSCSSSHTAVLIDKGGMFTWYVSL